MNSNEKKGLCLLDEIVDDLIHAQSETKAWNQELDPLNFNTISNMATYTLLNIQVEAEELMQKLSALKNLPVLALTDEQLSYLNELENQLLLVENRRAFYHL